MGVRHCGVGDGDLADELVTLVPAGVQLVAEMGLATVFRPARVDTFLRPFMGFPAERHGSLLDGVGFLAFVTLYRRLQQRGIDDLTATRQAAMIFQLLLELLEDQRARAGLGQAVAEQPMVLA